MPLLGDRELQAGGFSQLPPCKMSAMGFIANYSRGGVILSRHYYPASIDSPSSPRRFTANFALGTTRRR
jgi:hypothetical protein